MKPILLHVDGMTCQGCARSVEAALRRVPGVDDARVDLAAASAVVTGAEAQPELLIEALEQAGYDARVDP